MLYNNLIDTLQKLTHRENITQKEIAHALNISEGTLNKRVNRGTYDFKDTEIRQIGAFFNVDILKRVYIDNFLDDYRYKEEHGFNDDCVKIDYYEDVFGSCGNGTFVLSENKSIINVPKNCIAHYSGVKKYSVINARGDSMSPFINDMDRLIVEHSDNTNIIDNRIYIFRYEDSIFIKRLVHNIDQIIIKSDNKEYGTRYIERADLLNFQLIGQIVGLMRTIK